ncbi:MAG: chemotaxis protein CheA [Candidatus Riflebacteria bacterium]|nr:chemotaxis protein CheA [Candidatus Riflebacteria bacterium]
MFKGMEQEFLRVFVSESREFIEEVEPQLITIHENAEKTGQIDLDTINSVFRLFHSLKGSAASLGLNNIATLTHKAEAMLDMFRVGKAMIRIEHIDILMRALDMSRDYLDLVEANQSDCGNEAQKDALEGELDYFIQQVSEPETQAKAKARAKAKSKNKLPKLEKTLPQSLSPKDDDKIKPLVEQFVVEAIEILDNSEAVLIELEKATEESREQLIREVFRGIHSFKGNCGFLGFVNLESLSHKTETILDDFLNNGQSLAPEHVMTFLIIIDSLRQGVSDLAAGGVGNIEGQAMFEDLLDQMKIGLIAEYDDHKKIGEILLEEGTITDEQLEQALIKQQAALGEVLIDMGAVDNSAIDRALKKQSEQSSAAGKQSKKADIRVDTQKLDKLINLVGELLIAETMVTRNSDLKDLVLENFEKAVHHLRRITSELQDVAMSVRMIPLTMTFQKLVRVVHDIGRKSSKKVKLNLVGEETEVDKTMTEQIADPLVHMVRNAVDHGIESPEERLKLGKPEIGSVTIEARYEGGEVWIIVSDDGKGLNREMILEKAEKKGLLNKDPASMSDEETFNLIFEPGFSTADTVSEVSGRGVGMDVVKRNIENLKGRTTVKSKSGYGTSIYLQIPLTLAIIDGMLVRVGDSRYTIPLLSIRESLRPLPESITRSPSGEEILRIREDLISVIRLHNIHNKKPQFDKLTEGILVVVEEHGRRIAIFVDEILGQQQTVIKGLSSFLSISEGISGCTILGDGAISLILDIGSLIAKTGGNAYSHY